MSFFPGINPNFSRGKPRGTTLRGGCPYTVSPADPVLVSTLTSSCEGGSANRGNPVEKTRLGERSLGVFTRRVKSQDLRKPHDIKRCADALVYPGERHAAACSLAGCVELHEQPQAGGIDVRNIAQHQYERRGVLGLQRQTEWGQRCQSHWPAACQYPLRLDPPCTRKNLKLVQYHGPQS